jgi:hypothetical protein
MSDEELGKTSGIMWAARLAEEKARDAEIIRLTELVAWHEADKARFQDVEATHLREIERLKTEVERLRSALEDIAYPNPVHGEDQLMQIARAALTPSQETP